MKWFFSTYRFCKGCISKFILMLQKGVYLYEYIDDWKKVSEIFLPEKEDFYSSPNIEDVTDADMQKEFGMTLSHKKLK